MYTFSEIAKRTTAVFFLFAAMAPLAAADEYHYRNLLIGERAAGMGGAYTAISDTPDGAYYNPAGIAFITGNSLSASVNAFNHSLKTYEAALRNADGSSEDYEQKSSILLPNFFGVVSNFGGGKIGFSYAVPDSTQRKQSQNFTNLQGKDGISIDSFNININDVDNTYQFGPSLAYKLGDNWSIGTTVYAHYRDSTVIRNSVIQVANNYQWINGYEYKTEWGVKPAIGIMGGGNKMAFGFTLSRTFILSAENEAQVTGSGIDFGPLYFDMQEDDDEREFPWNATIGVAWFPTSALILAADCNYYSSVDDQNQESTVNLALGGEYYLSENWATRFGLYSDRSNTPEVKRGGKNQTEHVDIYGATLSLTRFTRSSSITLGINYAKGDGDAQIISGNNNVQDLTVENLGGFLSAAYSY